MENEIKCKQVAELKGGKWDKTIEHNRRVYSPNGLSPTIVTQGGGNQEVKILVDPIAFDEQNSYLRKDGCVGTITTDGSSPKHNNRIVDCDMSCRKLTERECFRLMGVKDEDFEKIAKHQSTSSLYHLAGDSIIVNVLNGIFKEML